MKHNKWVRDRIPDLITRRGDKPVTRILGADAYGRELEEIAIVEGHLKHE